MFTGNWVIPEENHVPGRKQFFFKTALKTHQVGYCQTAKLLVNADLRRWPSMWSMMPRYFLFSGSFLLLYHPLPAYPQSEIRHKFHHIPVFSSYRWMFAGWWPNSKRWCIALCVRGIRRCLIGVGSITEVRQRRARFIIGWVTAWDCQVPYTLGHRAAMSCHGARRTT